MSDLAVRARLRIKENVVTHVKRKLGSESREIYVKVGQEVYPELILGEEQISGGFRTVRLAQELRVNPEQAPFYLKRKIGQTIYQGELLAAKDELFGFTKIQLVSPVDGVIDFYDEKKGNLKIKLLPKKTRLASGVLGIVDKIDEAAGLIFIKTLATLVYGIFGSGREREGILKVINKADDLVSSRQIPNPCRNILVGGGLVFLDALQKAVDVGIPGIICGGINAKDYKSMVGGSWNLFNKQWSDVGLTVMVTEGFGSIPMGGDIYATLLGHNGRFAILDGNRARLILPTGDQNSMIYIRKTSLPASLEIESIQDTDFAKLTNSAKVRIIAGTYMGMQGKVEVIDQTPTRLPSGIETVLVTVDILKSKVRLPYLNLEIIS